VNARVQQVNTGAPGKPNAAPRDGAGGHFLGHTRKQGNVATAGSLARPTAAIFGGVPTLRGFTEMVTRLPVKDATVHSKRDLDIPRSTRVRRTVKEPSAGISRRAAEQAGASCAVATAQRRTLKPPPLWNVVIRAHAVQPRWQVVTQRLTLPAADADHACLLAVRAAHARLSIPPWKPLVRESLAYASAELVTPEPLAHEFARAA